MLGVYSGVITFVLQTIVEQAIALLSKLLESQERDLAPAIASFPSNLRFGVPTVAAHALAAGSVRHRTAAVALGTQPELQVLAADRQGLFYQAHALLRSDMDGWRNRLGHLVMENP